MIMLGILLFYAVLVLLTVFLCKWVWKKKRSKLLVLAIIMVAVICILGGTIYFGLVFLSGYARSTTYLLLSPKAGHTLPEVPKECSSVFETTDLHPYGLKKRPQEFKEYGNLWLLDSAKTVMYDSEILAYPVCLDHLVQEMAFVRTHRILVIYDKAAKSEVLIIKNYKTILGG